MLARSHSSALRVRDHSGAVRRTAYSQCSLCSGNHTASAAHANQAASAVRRVQQPCCMSSTRKLARLAAPVVCAAYVTYVAIDRGYYHIERRKELAAATARAKAEAARRVAADERR